MCWMQNIVMLINDSLNMSPSQFKWNFLLFPVFFYRGSAASYLSFDKLFVLVSVSDWVRELDIERRILWNENGTNSSLF